MVEQLNENPKFHRYATKTLRKFRHRAQTKNRDQLVRFADSLVECARSMVHAANQTNQLQLLSDHDRKRDQEWIEKQNQWRTERSDSPLDTRSVVEKIADKPWFDLIAEGDFFTGSWDLFLDKSDDLLLPSFDAWCPIPRCWEIWWLA